MFIELSIYSQFFLGILLAWDKLKPLKRGGWKGLGLRELKEVLRDEVGHLKKIKKGGA